MSEVILKPRRELRVPVDGRNISPDTFAGKALKELGALEVWMGKWRLTLGEVFQLEGEPGPTAEETRIRLEGGLGRLRWVGRGMSAGELVVQGSIGFYVGAEMRGGSIKVAGDAGSWLGLDMLGGLIEVQGDVGDCVGSSLRGEQAGMRGGTIIIHGSAGVELGANMRDGFIRVDGSVGLFAGVGMQGGTILIGGDSEGRLGAGMRGGKIILLGRVAPILPGFQAEEVQSKAKAGVEKIAGPFYVFSGDLVERGSGRLFVSASKNPHLKYKESFMW